MLASLAAAMLAGLLGSPHCVGMCGGFATVCSRQRGGLPLWHAGRLTTYAALGAAAGSFGAALPGPGWIPAALSAALLVWFAAGLAGLAPEPRPRLGWLGPLGAALARRSGPASRLGFGMLNGLLPCGMVYAALGIPVALGGPLEGALAMVAFGLGTVPALTLMPAAVRSFALRSIWHRRAVAVLVLAAGLWSVGARSGVVGGAAATPAAHGHGAHPAPGGTR